MKYSAKISSLVDIGLMSILASIGAAWYAYERFFEGVIWKAVIVFVVAYFCLYHAARNKILGRIICPVLCMVEYGFIGSVLNYGLSYLVFGGYSDELIYKNSFIGWFILAFNILLGFFKGLDFVADYTGSGIMEGIYHRNTYKLIEKLKENDKSEQEQ